MMYNQLNVCNTGMGKDEKEVQKDDQRLKQMR